MRQLSITAMAALAVLPGAAEASRFLVEDGKSDYVIVVPDQPVGLVHPEGETLDYAAAFLADNIEKATGCRLPVVAEGELAGRARFISVGPTRLALELFGDPAGFAPEELRIRTVPGGSVVICGEKPAGGPDRGTLFGIYEFLERVVGIHWFFGDDRWYKSGIGTFMPEAKTVSLPVLNVSEAPVLRQRVGGVSHYEWPDELERRWHPVLRFGDTRGHRTANHTQIGWVDLYADAHPEYFAIGRNGRRQINRAIKHRSYICLTNPDVLKQMIANIETFDKTGVSENAFGPCDPTPDYVFFCPNDGMTPETTCHCDGCIKFQRPERDFDGLSSELIFQFVKRYADAIQERWPGRKLVVLAYAHYKAPPIETPVPDNLVVTYVGPPIHYAMDPAVYAKHSEALRQWSKLLGNDPARLSLWFNIVSPNSNTSYVPIFYHHVFAKWLREHHEIISGIFINGHSAHLRRTAPRSIWMGFQSLPMVWIQGKLMWNPHLDPDALLERYCRGVYGAAAETMLELHKLVASRWEGLWDADDEMDEASFIHRVRYPEPVMSAFCGLLEKAAAEAEGDERVSAHIGFLRKYIYSLFIEENRDFHRWADSVPAYECLPAAVAPEIDGVAEEAAWRNTPEFKLVSRQWGEASPRRTTLMMRHDADFLYVFARFGPGDPANAGNECLRIQVGERLDRVRGTYAVNIPHRRWKAFLQIQIAADGEISSLDDLGPETKAATFEADGDLCFEARISLKHVAPHLRASAMPQLRMQFVREWGVWDVFDVWSPTLSHISDMPTYRFGLVQFVLAKEKKTGSSEE
ncbi:MAG: DUF4838 domain-containing protein [Kiritimatiellia bacterium]|jgi:hypothetical protein